MVVFSLVQQKIYMNKILVTGFDRFGYTQSSNRSSELVLPTAREAYGSLVETLVLPTAHDIAAQQLIQAIEELNPVAVVMFGISAGSKVRLETRAKNRRLSLLMPDNEGIRKAGRLDPAGPLTYDSTLPLDNIYERLTRAHVPVSMSRDAGTFVCNEVMYKALRHNGTQSNNTTIPTGFIHLGNGLRSQFIEEATVAIIDEIINYTDTELTK
jgi:pyroglutamyl-peptidase